MHRLKVAMTTMLVLACTSPGPSAQREERMTTRLQFEILDGGLARTVSENGLANGLQPFIAEDARLVWPGTEVIVGPDAIHGRLKQVSWLDSALVMWQPLRVHEDGDPSLILSQVVVSLTTRSNEGRLNTLLGRALMVWGGDSSDFRIRSLMLTSFQVPPLPSVAAPEPEAQPAAAWQASPGAEPVAKADSALRADVERNGPRTAFQRWFAPTGNTTAGNGRLNIGPPEVAEALGAVDSVSSWQMTATAGGISANGGLGWSSGTIAIRSKSGEPATRAAMWHYMLFWERQPDGEFKVVTAATNPWQSASLGTPAH